MVAKLSSRESDAEENGKQCKVSCSSRNICPDGGAFPNGLLLWTMLVESDCWKEEGGKNRLCTALCSAYLPGVHLLTLQGSITWLL